MLGFGYAALFLDEFLLILYDLAIKFALDLVEPGLKVKLNASYFLKFY